MVWDSGCYQLHGQTGWSTVWVNGISKIQDWHLIISSRNRDYHWSAKSVLFTEKQPRKRETGIKDVFEESVWNIPTRKPRLPFQMVRRSRKFSTERPEKFCSIVPSNQIFPETFANGKKPLSPVMLAGDIYWSVDKIWHRPIYFHLCDLFHSQD